MVERANDATGLVERCKHESERLFPPYMRDGHSYHSVAFTLDQAADTITRLLAREEALCAALEPFARAADEIARAMEQHPLPEGAELLYQSATILAAHLYAARAALQPPAGEGDGVVKRMWLGRLRTGSAGIVFPGASMGGWTYAQWWPIRRTWGLNGRRFVLAFIVVDSPKSQRIERIPPPPSTKELS